MPSDLDEVERRSPWSAIVREFREQRTLSPTSTGGQLQRVGRGDVHPLHGPASGRAATWYDPEAGVCWFLAFTPSHDYVVMEQRAARGNLLPSEDDEALLEVEREELDFALRVGPGVRALVADALGRVGTPARGTVGRLMRLEVSAIVEAVGHDTLVDVFLSVRLPPLPAGAHKPRGWPGNALMARLASLATGLPAGEVDCQWTDAVPDNTGIRAVDPARELAVVVRNWEPRG